MVAPKVPPGCIILYSLSLKFLTLIRDTQIASPKINDIVVEVVGANPIEHASFEFGINNGILHNLKRVLYG